VIDHQSKNCYSSVTVASRAPPEGMTSFARIDFHEIPIVRLENLISRRKLLARCRTGLPLGRLRLVTNSAPSGSPDMNMIGTRL
jgi:hypothetical protein